MVLRAELQVLDRFARIILVGLATAMGYEPTAAIAAVATHLDGSGVAIVTGAIAAPDGSPMAGARVTLTGTGGRSVMTTGADGRYELEVPAPGTARLVVQAPGYPPVTLDVDVTGARHDLAPVVLARPTFSDEIVVTAAGAATRLGETAASILTLSREELWAAGSTTVDGALRQAPGFALFRRSGSRTANPTAQGVSLRGVGASGASRAVVLDDGIPLNDAFGGWIHWARVPRAALGRVEVLRGGGSDLYGSGALGGVVQLFRPGADPGLSFEASYGSQSTPDASAAARLRRGDWSIASSAEAFRTDGYVAVAPEERGPVDTAVSSNHGAFDVSVERTSRSGARAFVRGAYFEESRANGTPFQRNDTRLRQLSGGLEARAGQNDLWLRGWATSEDFGQTFSAVSADRRSERPLRFQSVPSSSVGLAARWSRAVAENRLLVAGAELSGVKGETDERVLGPAGESLEAAGGRQGRAAVHAGSLVGIGSRFRVAGGARLDWWRNRQGSLTAGGVTTPLPDRRETALSPRLSLLVQASPRVSIAASAYRGFRAPTLNELYRSFRVGNVSTAANADLRAERMTGFEAGASWSHADRARLRANLFWMDLDRTVANVTLSVQPALITRQRQNLGRARSRGIEVDAVARLGRAWAVSFGYLLSDATVREFSADTSLEGLRLPQIPRHSAALQLRYDGEVGSGGLQARWTGAQFDDDLNRLPLRGFVSIDAEARRPLGRGLEAFVGGENLTGVRYDVGRTPVRTIGPPRSVRAGLRLRLGGTRAHRDGVGSTRTADAGGPGDAGGGRALRPEADEHGMAQ
jgi:outer membrane receptor protein involved in Fe transport